MGYKAEVFVDPRRIRGPIHPEIYGQFIEHIGRAIYGGVVDERGYRADVIEAVRGLAPTVLRWPGGNFASGYHWRDGVGPRDERPARRDLAWSTIENNSFGTEEFLEYCRQIDASSYINLNMGTGTADEALQWLEYCNAEETGLPEVALRRAGPHPDPHGVKIWGLGNEVYGWWQHGHTSAESYSEMAREWGKLLRWTEPNIRLVGVGANDPDWNWTVLKTAGRSIDWLSLHFYWRPPEDNQYYGTLAAPLRSEQEIVAAHGMCLAAQKLHQMSRPINIAVDEWGVWWRSIKTPIDPAKLLDHGFSARSGVDTRFEEPYDLTDALAIASWLHVLWRHPQKVTLATQAQMVNAIAPIFTTRDAVIRNTIYWPLAIARREAGTHALDLSVETDEEVEAPGLTTDSIPALDAAATVDEGRVHLSLVNRSKDQDCELVIHGVNGAARIHRLWHEDVLAGNSPESPENVVPIEERADEATRLVIASHSHVTTVFDR